MAPDQAPSDRFGGSSSIDHVVESARDGATVDEPDGTLRPTPRDDAAAAAILTAASLALLHHRTRGLGFIALAAVLSRAHADARQRLEAEFLRLFDQRQSVHRRIDELEADPAIDDLAGRLNALEHRDELGVASLERRLADLETVIVDRRFMGPEDDGTVAVRRLKDRVAARRRGRA